MKRSFATRTCTLPLCVLCVGVLCPGGAVAGCGSSQDQAGAEAGADAGRDSSTTDAPVESDSGASTGPDSSGPTPGADGSVREAGPLPPDPCIEAGSCPPGTWVDVTPPEVDLVNGACGNYGTETVQVDPMRPAELYTLFMCQGIWKSTDYGQTWHGPINTGTGGAMAGNSAGGITIAPSSATEPPVIYLGGIRGDGTGFWKSTDGGVSWKNYSIAPAGARQDFYPPVVDPYDAKHLLMAGHEQDALVQSIDGGENWTSVSIDNGMNENGGTAAIFFLDTGSASTTRSTWMWMAQQSGGTYGTWRTTNSGGAWKRVDANEHPHGASQIYQPDTGGVVYMAGAYSSFGWGVLRSTDWGVTWAHVGGTGNEEGVFGTPKNVYAMNGGPVGAGGVQDPSLEVAAQPGTGTWMPSPTPSAMTQGSAQVAVTSDGTHHILVAANWNAGIWRYVEP